MGGVKGTRYLLKIRNQAPRTTHHGKPKTVSLHFSSERRGTISLSVQEKKRKIEFQDGFHGGHLGFPIRTILAFFYLKVTPILPSKFGVNWLLGLGEETKNRFSNWMPVAILDLRSARF